MEFAGRVVVVTGAAGGLGHAVAQAFAAQGAVCARWDLRTDAMAALPGAEHLDSAVDLLDAGAVAAAAKATIDAAGRVDVLCNVAGGFKSGSPVHESGELLDRLLDLNVRTMVHAVQAIVPAMLAAGRGKIVNVGASRALAGSARSGAYVASKSAVIRLTETMALELRSRGINVNCVLPSIIDTAANRADMPNADPAKWVKPEELAEVMLFLSSERARAIHGAAVPVVGLS